MYGVAALVTAGEPASARALLGQLRAREENGYMDPFAVAVAHAALGETAVATEWVRRTYHRRSPSAFCLLTEPLLDPAREEPGFREVIRRLAFPSR
jgi:hypothetical protein